MTDTAEHPAPQDSEFSRPVERARMGDGIRHLVADEAERKALAKRLVPIMHEAAAASRLKTENSKSCRP